MTNVFVTYAWGDSLHEEKVISFTDFLRQKGFNAVIDRLLSQQETAVNFTELMHKTINSYDKIIVLLSKEYKQKAENFIGGVGIEYNIILNDIKNKPTKYILISFNGINSDIIPLGFLGREVVDLISDEKNDYRTLFSKLSDAKIYNFSEVSNTKPKIEAFDIPKFTLTSNESKIEDLKERIEDGVYKYADGHFDVTINPSEFFYNRLVRSFPGVRGLKIFEDSKQCIDRLMLLLKQPLKFKLDEGSTVPVWWFRGGSNMYIENVRRLSDTKILLDHQEMEIKRIAVFNSSMYYKSFVYVEVNPDIQTGLYNIPQTYIQAIASEGKRYTEEYAIFNGIPITREEFDDGAAEVASDIVETHGAELRIRHLTPYNFVITGQASSINSPYFDINSKDILNGILIGKRTLTELCEMIEELPKHGDYPLG